MFNACGMHNGKTPSAALTFITPYAFYIDYIDYIEHVLEAGGSSARLSPGQRRDARQSATEEHHACRFRLVERGDLGRHTGISCPSTALDATTKIRKTAFQSRPCAVGAP
jgi:hypothetical protein